MIPLDDALKQVLDCARPLEAERVSLDSAVRRVLAEDVYADVDMPPFNKACVDGYACRRTELGASLRVVETVAAGAMPERAVHEGECAKIMTGAMLPEGAECVFMVEQSETAEDGRVRFTGNHTNDNVTPRGADVKVGDQLLREGHWICPQDVAVLAMAGYDAPFVARQPRVAVIATGDELVEPGVRPEGAQIRNSNSPTLVALVHQAGAIASNLSVARDTRASLEAALAVARRDHDVVCFSGGVSMGDFDFVPEVLEAAGYAIHFDRVAIQPGKPTLFASGNRGYCFGLPGNPVSSFVTFELIVRPFLLKLMGHVYEPPNVVMPLAKAISREHTRREAWMPVVLNGEGQVERVEYHGSAHVNALSYADGLIRMPEGIATMAEDERVCVRLIR